MKIGRRRSRSGVRIGVVLLALWFVIGAVAAGQRGYYDKGPDDCASFGTIVVTILAGPLNYVGANPKIKCSVPQPSE